MKLNTGDTFKSLLRTKKCLLTVNVVRTLHHPISGNINFYLYSANILILSPSYLHGTPLHHPSLKIRDPKPFFWMINQSMLILVTLIKISPLNEVPSWYQPWKIRLPMDPCGVQGEIGDFIEKYVEIESK